ncbi:MAG: type II toxin-antitoxin system TacA family antitoxin [Methylomagnum sp.]
MSIKRERLHLRLDLVGKNLIEEAATCQHKTASGFVLNHALAAAEKVVAEYRRSIRLSDQDWERFCETLENPPDPNPALISAAQRYNDQITPNE